MASPSWVLGFVTKSVRQCYEWAGKRIFVHVFAFPRSQGKSSELAMFISEDVAKWQRGMVQNRHQSGWHFQLEDPLRQGTARRHQNPHFLGKFDPLRQMMARRRKICISLGKFDPLRQLSWLAEGGSIVKSCLTSTLFWPSAIPGLAEGPSKP